MKRLGQIAAGIGATLTGLGAAIFLHPRAGARNREAAAGVARRQGANVAALVGTSVKRAPGGRGRADDRLAQQVRDHLAATLGDGASSLVVVSERGTVTLRGEVVRLDDIDAYEAATREVGGVTDVNNLLRLPAAGRAAAESRPALSPDP